MRLVFDLGGVVLRWQPESFLVRLLPERVPDAVAARAFVAGFFEGFGGDWAEFDRGRIAPDLLAERAAARVGGLTAAEARRLIDAVPEELQPVPEVVALLRRLREGGHRLHFLSNMPLAYAARLEASHAVFGLFESGVFSSRVNLIKPEAALFAHAAEVFGETPAGLLLIDDNETNVAAARRAGWRGLHFEAADPCETELRRQGRL